MVTTSAPRRLAFINLDMHMSSQATGSRSRSISGRLKKVIVRTTNDHSNKHITASVWVGVDGTADFNAGGSIIQHVTQSMGAAATATNVNFSGSTPHFAANDIVGLAINFQLNPGNTNVTCIWEYDDTAI